MVESHSEPSVNRPDKPRDCWHYGDLAVFGFERLREKYNPTDAELPDPPHIEHAFSALCIDKVNAQQGLANQLQSSLLPLLQGQINSLFLALKPPSLRNEPKSNLRLVLNIQADIDCSLDEIKHSIATICPETASQPTQSDDHHLKELKSYRLYRLKKTFQKKLSYRMYDIFGAAVELIQHAGLSSTPLTAEGDTNSLQKTLRFSVNHALHNIKMMTNCLQASELTVVQDSWQRRRGCIRTMLQSTVEKLTLSTNSTSAKYQAQPPEKFVGETVIQLAKLTLPIMKLCKIFFAKFSNRGLALERLPNFTEISSGQLEDLVNSVGHVVDDIRQLMLHLSFANGHPGGDATSEDFTRIAKSLKSRFESPLFLVLMYFIPLIPDPDGLDIPFTS